MVLARLLLIIALVAIGIAGTLYLVTKDRRYLKFIGAALRLTVIVAICVFLFFAARRFGAHI
jgi:hypothetical protein